MKIGTIENNIQALIQEFSRDTFVFDFLLAYDTPKSIITKLRDGNLNVSKIAGEVLWKKKILFKTVLDSDLHLAIDSLKSEPHVISYEPRFIIVTDYNRLLAIDSRTKDSLDIAFDNLINHFDFFLPLAGLEKAQYKGENPADVKAAEKMAKLYDEIRKDNSTDTTEKVHSLNVFLSRLLFCFFAEDTEIFEPKQFVNAIISHTQTDGSDLQIYLERLFDVLNKDYPYRQGLPNFLDAFPYVNGGLFKDSQSIPQFTHKSRKAIIECGELNWKDINPDIFGSMIQAVITPEHRGGLGMHYTSVPNIMKVIEPLFLRDLYEEFENISYQPQKLNNLLYRLSKIKIFDPACGSGNFLIIAYKELRLLEIKIIKQIEHLQRIVTGSDLQQLALIPKPQQHFAAIYQRPLFSNIQLSNFFGIELDDFAHEIAILSLWLAQHQMNMKFKEVLGQGYPTLPLKESGRIVHGNATRLDWQFVCPKKGGDETYILGNPPYLGSRRQNDMQKEDLASIFKNDYKSVDYIAAWFYKGAEYIKGINSKCAFVSTNSICQGEQVSLIWKRILNESIEIGFAHKDFKWTNSAKNNAAVIVIIVGLQNVSKNEKFIYTQHLKSSVATINPYLIAANTIYIESRQKPLSNFPEMNFGNMPADGGKLLFTTEQKEAFILQEPKSNIYFKRLISAYEFLNGQERWCLWLEDCPHHDIELMPLVSKLVNELKLIREKSSRPQLALIPHLFAQITQPKNKDYILIPRHSSENRTYIPLGYFSHADKAHDSCLIIPTNEIYLLGLLMSKMHMQWVRTVGGRIKTDYRYSKDIIYNNFPCSPLTILQKSELQKHVFRILEERERYSERTLSQLYDPDKMPEQLKEAHHQLDLAVERCYRSRPFENDEDRLEYLFKLYEKMIDDKKTTETLLESVNKTRKSKPLKHA